MASNVGKESERDLYLWAGNVVGFSEHSGKESQRLTQQGCRAGLPRRDM